MITGYTRHRIPSKALKGDTLKGFHLTNEGLLDAAYCSGRACQTIASAKSLHPHWNAAGLVDLFGGQAFDPFRPFDSERH